jgi:prenyltransferase beta subunit
MIRTPAGIVLMALLMVAGTTEGAPGFWRRLLPKSAPQPVAADYWNVAEAARFVPQLDRPNLLPRPLVLDVTGTSGELVPLQAGVPFPEGMITRPQTLRLQDSLNRELPLQTRVLAYWPDGSARWLLLDTVLDLPNVGKARILLADGEAPRDDNPLVATEDDTTIRLASGGLNLLIPRQGAPRLIGLPRPLDGTWELTAEVENGTVCRASGGTATSRIVESGPVRATVVVSGTLIADGTTPFHYDMAISLVQGIPALLIRPVIWSAAPDMASRPTRTTLAFGATIGNGTLAFGGDRPATRFRRTGEAFLLSQAEEGYEARLGEAVLETGTHSAGWILVDGLCLAVRRFDRPPPRTLTVEDHSLVVDLTTSGGPVEVMLAFGLAGAWDAQRLSKQLNEPALVHPGAQWVARSGAFGWFPVIGEDTAEFDDLCAAAERPDFYRQWVRTGKRKWFDTALDQPYGWISDLVARYLFTGDQQALVMADWLARTTEQGNWSLADLYETTRNPAVLHVMERNNEFVSTNLLTGAEGPLPVAVHGVGLVRSAPFFTGRKSGRIVADLERIVQWELAYGMYPEKRRVRESASSYLLEMLVFLHRATGKDAYRDLAETVYDALAEDHTTALDGRSMLAYAALRQPPPNPSDTIAPPRADVAFLASCQNDDGGFGLVPGFPSDLDSTYRAVESLYLLRAPVPDRERCARWVAACRLPSGGYGNAPGAEDADAAWTCFALYTLALSGVPPDESEKTMNWLHNGFQADGAWSSTGGSPNSSASATAYAVQAMALLNQEVPDTAATRLFLLSRQIDRGGFGDRDCPDITTTGLALTALGLLPGTTADRDYTPGLRAWLASLRRTDGGYGWPSATRSTLAHTAHALSCVRAISTGLSEQELSRTRRFVRECRSSTGGFAPRPGRTPTVLDTWYGVRAAVYLGPEPTPERSAAPEPRTESGR